MKIVLTNLVPAKYNPSVFTRILKYIEDQVNLLAEGRLQGRHFNATTIPTSGNFMQGDFVWKSDLTETGSAGSKYIVIGWACTVAGSPGTLREMRVLTGN